MATVTDPGGPGAPGGPRTQEQANKDLSRQDQTLLLFAGLMEGGMEDDETCKQIDRLTRLLNEDVEAAKKGEPSICAVIDCDCVDTMLGYLDMRQPDIVRGHATLATSAYLKAAGEDGSKKLNNFFLDKVKRGTYDDYIVAFCVAAAIFPVVPDLTAEMFLSEGFLPSLGPLIRRKWKSRKVETACLEMLNAACMNAACREAVFKYCGDWLEEIVDQDPADVIKAMYAQNPDVHLQEGSIAMRRHSEQVQNMAAVILAKLRATLPPNAAATATGSGESSGGGRIQQATTSIEDLSKMFTKMLAKDPERSRQSSIEGLAYASLQPKVKEQLVADKEFLKDLVSTLKDAPPRSPLTYGALSILANLTRYQPVKSEEEKKMDQLKAYANAAGKIQEEPLNDDDHVAKRCMTVFAAGVTPVLVSHSKNGSAASLSLIISIISSLSASKSIRGSLAQQGAVRLLIDAWNSLPTAEPLPRRTAAHALARILISTNPSLVFGGTRPTPQSAAIRPLVSIINPDPAADSRNLLPTFESLMALTNLASTDDDTRGSITRAAWAEVDEQLLSSNKLVARAAAELVCNLVQSVEAVVLYAEDTPQAENRLKVILALADAEDAGTRSAAGGALATLAAYEEVARKIAARDNGVRNVLGLCVDDSEDIRHRGAFIANTMILAEGEAGRLARDRFRAEQGVALLTECVKKSRRPEVIQIVTEALGKLLEEEK